MVCLKFIFLFVAVSVALIPVTFAHLDGSKPVQQVTGSQKLSWDTSLYQQRSDNDVLSSSPASSNFPLASSSIAIDQHYKHDNLWDNESINISASIQLKLKYRNMLNSINNNQLVCTQTANCAARPGTDCCWIPGKKNTKQCTTRNEGDRVGWNFLFTVKNRKQMFDLMQFSIVLNKPYFTSVALPVGQGDCVAMFCPNGDLVMFDCGSSNPGIALTALEVKEVLKDHMKRITIFISHGDLDHYKYLPTIFDDISKIDRVIIGGEPKEYNHQTFTAIQNWIRDLDTNNKLYAINKFKKCIGTCNDKLHRAKYDTANTKWTAGNVLTELKDMNICGINSDVGFDIIAANVGKQKNRKSIVLKVTATKSGKTRSMLLSGDIEGSSAKTVAKVAQNRLKSDIYQISHHGASTLANKFEWLDAIQPKQAFVSHAYHSQFAHPRCEAIRNLISIGSVLTSTKWFTTTHPFMCGDRLKNKQYVRYDGEICHHIFSTYPTSNSVCVIRINLQSDTTTSNCYT